MVVVAMRVMHRPCWSVVGAAALLLALAGAPRAHAEGGTLSEEQAKEKASFDERMERRLSEFERDCGYALPVTTDFETFNEAAWAKTSERSVETTRPADICGFVVRSLAESCQSEGKPSKQRDLVAKSVKALACVFSGYSPRGKSEGSDVQTQRNLSLRGGTFTVHLGANLGNIDENVRTIFRAATGQKSFSDRAAGQNGARCDRWLQCESSVCIKGLCQPCGPKARCQKPGSTCAAGMCWTEAQRAGQAAHDAEYLAERAAKKPCKPRGATCKANVECCGTTCGHNTCK